MPYFMVSIFWGQFKFSYEPVDLKAKHLTTENEIRGYRRLRLKATIHVDKEFVYLIDYNYNRQSILDCMAYCPLSVYLQIARN